MTTNELEPQPGDNAAPTQGVELPEGENTSAPEPVTAITEAPTHPSHSSHASHISHEDQLPETGEAAAPEAEPETDDAKSEAVELAPASVDEPVGEVISDEPAAEQESTPNPVPVDAEEEDQNSNEADTTAEPDTTVEPETAAEADTTPEAETEGIAHVAEASDETGPALEAASELELQTEPVSESQSTDLAPVEAEAGDADVEPAAVSLETPVELTEAEAEEVVESSLPPEDIDAESAMVSGAAEDADEGDEGIPQLVTELEYLVIPKKGGEEDDDAVPQFASVGEARAVLEGFLFTTNEPLSVIRLSRLCGNLHPKTVRALVLELQMEYDGRPGGLQVVEVAGGFQMATRPHIAEWMFRLHRHRRKSALSPATLETLAIIAYKQPVTKGEVEAIRGVESSGTFRTLQDLNLIDVGGRREVPGRPQLYVTTTQFLKGFGLNALADLPTIAELRHRFADDTKLKVSAPATQTLKPTDESAEGGEGTEARAAGEKDVASDEQAYQTPSEAADGVAVPVAEPVTADADATGDDEGGFTPEEVARALEAAKGEKPKSSNKAKAGDSGDTVALKETEPEPEPDFDEDDDADSDEEDLEDDDEESEDDEEYEDDYAEEDEELDPEEDSAGQDEPDDSSAIEDPGAAPIPVEIRRLPKPPKKAGWGVGRPLFGEEEE